MVHGTRLTAAAAAVVLLGGCAAAPAAPGHEPTVAMVQVDWVYYASFAEAMAKAGQVVVADLISTSCQTVAPTPLGPSDPKFTDPYYNPYYDPHVPGSGYPPSDAPAWTHPATVSALTVTEVIKGTAKPGATLTLVQGGGTRPDCHEPWSDTTYLSDTTYRHFLIFTSEDTGTNAYPLPPVAPAYGIWVVGDDGTIWPLTTPDTHTPIGTPDLPMSDPAWYPSSLTDIHAMANHC